MESILFVRGGSLLYISIKKAFLTFWLFPYFFLYHPFCDRQYEIQRHLVWKVPSNFQLIKEGTSWKFKGASCRRRLRIFSSQKARAGFDFKIETCSRPLRRAENSKAPRVRGAFEFSARRKRQGVGFDFVFFSKLNRNLLPAFFAKQKIRRRLLHEAPSNF